MKRATLVTPNLPELALLSGLEIADSDGLRVTATALAARLQTPVLAKGGHLPGDSLVDCFVQPFSGGGGGMSSEWTSKRIDTRHNHGTGCTLASAIAAELGRGAGMVDAIGRAREFVRGAMLAAPGFGAGHGPMGHWAANEARMNLNQVTLPARDYDEAVDFYRRLGLTHIVDSRDNGYARFECPGGATLSVHVDTAPLAGDTITYLESAELDDWMKALWQAGIKVAQQPRDESWGWREARLTDPSGNKLCLYHAGTHRRFPPWRISTAK
jgi:hydroxymethylpyrimidine/phosphomethylpyrimidine kinase